MSRTAGPRTVRQMNRELTLALFSDGRPRSRAAVARETGLTKPSVSSIIDSLIEEGMLVPAGVGEAANSGGRRPNLVAFNPDARAYLGVHLGVRRSTVAVADALGRTIAHGSVASSIGDPERGVLDLRAAVRRTAARAGVSPDAIASVGVSVAGLVDHRTGHCVLAPNLKWENVPLREQVADLFGAPAVVYNEAHAGALAEQRHGATGGVESFVRLAVGSGIGAGVVLDSKLYSGSTGIGGELGHCRIDDVGRRCACGNHGCLETVSAEPAILRSVEDAVAEGRSTLLSGGCELHEVIAAAQQEDEVAVWALRRAGAGLGRGIAYLLNVLNPELVVIGGPVAAAGGLLLEAVREAVPESSLPQANCEIILSSLTKSEVDGAVLLAREYEPF